MKFSIKILITMALLIAAKSITAQDRDAISVPRAEMISRITFLPVDKGERPMLNRKSLLAILPSLIPAVDPTYLSDAATQGGTIILQNGTMLEWSTVDGASLLLRKGERSQLFYVFSGKVEKALTVPKAEDIARFSHISGKQWHTKGSLLAILDGLVPSNTGFYLGTAFQHGSLTLKDGTVLHWTAAGKDHLVLRNGKKRRLYSVDHRGELTIPNAEDISRISSLPQSDNRYFTAETLLDTLPKFIPGGIYVPDRSWQYGYIELRSGVTINWRADSKNTLVLFNRGGETYFRRPDNADK